MKNRLNVTLSQQVCSLLSDHERYGYSSQSAMIDAAVSRLVEPIQNTPEIQAIYQKMEERMLGQLKEHIRMQVYNEVREFWQLLEDQKNELSEEDQAILANQQA